MKARAGLILVLVALATLPADAARRTPKRVPPTQAPNAGWCPLYRGSFDSQPQQSSSGGKLVFTAAASSHRVTVVSCDRAVDGAFPAVASDLFLTDVTVAKLPTWLAGLDQNYPAYQHAACDLDVSEPGRFNRSATAPNMPFRDLFFPAPSPAWLLQGAEAATGSGCAAGFPANQGCLVLARASRAGATDGRCTSASLTVGGLTAGDDYVVDFDWYSSAPPAGGFQAMDVYLMDAPAALSIADVTVNEGNAGTSNATFTVRLDPTIGQELTVQWSTANASASAPGDYQAASGTLTFAASASTATLNVPIVGDTAVEGNETFLVNLGTPSVATVERLDSQAVGTIVDDDGGAQPTLSVAAAQVTEGNSGTTNATFTATLSPASASPVTVQYRTEDVEAQGTLRTVTASGAITVPGSGSASPYPASLTVPAGLQGTVTKVTARLFGLTHTWPRDLDVLLVGPTGQAVVLMSDVANDDDVTGVDLVFDDLGPALGTGTLVSGTFKPTNLEDNEPAGDSWPGPAPAGPYANALSAFAGLAPTGTWQLFVFDDSAGDSGALGGFSLTFELSGGDYQTVSGTLTFAPGTTTRTVAVPVIGDVLPEPDERFLLQLENPQGAALGTSAAHGTILDDDDAVQVSIGSSTAVERDAPGLAAGLIVSLSAAAGGAVTVPWATTNGTASAPGDFTSGSGTLTFAPGETSKAIQIAITGDPTPEPRESFFVDLGTPTGAELNVVSGVVTIRDDDPAPIDFGLDGKSDVVVYRSGAWLPFDYATGNPLSGAFTGQPQSSCIPAPADFDGDGRAEFSQLCGDKWYFYNASGTLVKTITSTGGNGSDLPVPADYDGDGKDDVVMYRAGPPQWAGAWLFFSYQTGQQVNGIFTGHPPHFTGGTPTPYPGDFDGDGKADFSIYSGGPWHFYNADGTYKKGIWVGSIPNDIPVAGDYDGDGADEVVVWRAGAWLHFDFETGLYQPSASVFTGAPPHFTGGVPLPSPLDVDGDGDLDLSVYSGGPWHFYAPAGTYAKGIWCGAVAGDRPLSRRPLP